MLSGALIACIGLFMIYGTFRGWEWLIDPSEHLWFVYPLSTWKLVFGNSGLHFLTYALGIFIFFFGIYTFAEATI